MDFDVKTENFEKTRLSIVKLAVWLVYNAFLILYNGYRMMLGSKDAIRIVPYFVLPQFFYSITVRSPVRIPADDPYTQNQYQLRLPAPPANYQTQYIHQ